MSYFIFVTASSEEKAEPPRKEDRHSTVQVSSEVNHGRHQRPSLIEFLTGGDHGGNRHSHHQHEHEHNPQQRGKF